MEKMKKVGYIKDYYPEQRCIIKKIGGGRIQIL